jgi:hypothetical protein
MMSGKTGDVYLLDAVNLGGVGGQLASLSGCSGFGGLAYIDSAAFVPCTSGLLRVEVSGRSLRKGWQADASINWLAGRLGRSGRSTPTPRRRPARPRRAERRRARPSRRRRRESVLLSGARRWAGDRRYEPRHRRARDPVTSFGATVLVVSLHLSQNPAADALLDRDPLALLIAMLLD